MNLFSEIVSVKSDV